MPGVEEAMLVPGYGGFGDSQFPGEFGGMQPPGGFGGMQPPSGPTQEEIKRQKAAQKRREDQALIEQRQSQRYGEVSAPIPWEGIKKTTLDIKADKDGVSRASLMAPIQLDRSQQLRIGGTYMPGYRESDVSIPSTFGLEAGYETPGLDVRVGYTDRRRGGGAGMGVGGFEASARGKMNW